MAKVTSQAGLAGLAGRAGQAGVALCGAVALVVLARTAAYYAHADGLALGLVLTMTLALVTSVAELLQRVGRAERLTREVAALPRPATLASVEGSSDELRPILLSRLANAGGAVAGAPLAGYVVGLLVMLGLLGTFLGLFETLRGAREALTSSGDVETLRASLGAPMQGLTRSFGTSAAGVSASALLGLAVALSRRIEGRFALALGSYAAGALAPLTVQGRQLAALERLAGNAEALPRAVVALDEAAARLGSLEVAWGAAHAKASEQTSRAFEEAIVSIKGELTRAIERSGAAAEAALAPLVTRAVEGSVAAAKEHLTGLGETLSADLQARRAEEVTHARARDEALAKLIASEDTRAKKLAALWTDATRTLEATLTATDARAKARDEAFSRAGAELSKAAGQAIESVRERLVEAGERAAAQAEQLGTLAAAVEKRSETANAAALAQSAAVDTLLAGVAARTEAQGAELRAGHAKVVAELQRGAAEYFARTEAQGAELRAAHARLVTEIQRGATEHFVRAEALDAASRTTNAQLVTELQRGAAEHFARAEAFDAQARAGHAQLVAEIQRGTSEHFVRAEAQDAEARAAHAQLVAEIQRGATEHFVRTEAQGAEARETHAQLVAEIQRGAAEHFERVEAQDAEARETHAQLVTEIQRGAAEHADRATALERNVGATLAAQAERLIAAMEAHAKELEARFDAVSAAVRDAAAGVQAGGGELASVAEMFAGAVDRHREGAAEWLAGLGTIEGAIARAAGETAGGALAEQLDRARELYDGQLQFHRELLVQLRGIHVAAEPRRELREKKEEDAPA